MTTSSAVNVPFNSPAAAPASTGAQGAVAASSAGPSSILQTSGPSAGLLFAATVPAERLAEIRHAVGLFTRRAARKGLPDIDLVEGVHSFVPDTSGARPGTNPGLLPLIEMVEIEIAASGPLSLAGWSLLGRVDTLPDGSPIIARTPGTEAILLPAISDPHACAQCGKIRRRNETFLVYNIGGSTPKQVGRSCLLDFLGHDPAVLLDWHKSLVALQTSFLGWAGPATEHLWPTDAILALSARVAAHGGFLGKFKAREINEENEAQGLSARPHVEPTVSKVLWRLDAPRAMSKRELRQRIRMEAEWDRRYPDDRAAAELLELTREALVGATTNPGSEWEANVAAVTALPQLRAIHLGVAASAVVLGLKRQDSNERVERAAKPAAPSVHIGTVGERLRGISAVITFTRPFEDELFGTRTLVRLQGTYQGQDAALVWWASGTPFRPDAPDAPAGSMPVPWAVGDQVVITGTVKAHDRDKFDGRPQTVLNRCLVSPV